MRAVHAPPSKMPADRENVYGAVIKLLVPREIA